MTLKPVFVILRTSNAIDTWGRFLHLNQQTTLGQYHFSLLKALMSKTLVSRLMKLKTSKSLNEAESRIASGRYSPLLSMINASWDAWHLNTQKRYYRRKASESSLPRCLSSLRGMHEIRFATAQTILVASNSSKWYPAFLNDLLTRRDNTRSREKVKSVIEQPIFRRRIDAA